MNVGHIAVITTLLFLTQGCEKAREALVEKAEKLFESANNSYGATAAIVDLAEPDYGTFVNQRDHLVVVMFSADWCAPCRQLAPAMEKVSSDFGDMVKVGRLNVDHARQVATNAGVSGIPDVRFFHNGRQVHQFTGSRTRSQLREVFQKYISEIENDNLNAPTFAPELQPLAGELRNVTRDLQATPPQRAQTGEEAENDGGSTEPTIRPMDRNWMPPGMERR